MGAGLWGASVTSEEFRAILDAATKRPWEIDDSGYVISGGGEDDWFDAGTNATAIVSTMNLAEKLCELWAACERWQADPYADYRGDVIDALEALKPTQTDTGRCVKCGYKFGSGDTEDFSICDACHGKGPPQRSDKSTFGL